MADSYIEGYKMGLSDALTGAGRCICDGGPEIALLSKGYEAGHRRGKELAARHREREAERELEL
jgi:hypothetical protein